MNRLWVVPFVWKFASRALRRSLSSCHPLLSMGPFGLPLPVAPPCCPIALRLGGFGRPSLNRSSAHDRPSFFLIFHFAWEFLDRHDRAVLCAFSTIRQYARLRLDASTTCLLGLRRTHRADEDNIPTKLNLDRARFNSMALLAFNFDYGDFQRWLGGRYTNSLRRWDSVFRSLWHQRRRYPPWDQPVVDPHRAYLAMTDGIPLLARYGLSITPHNNQPVKDREGDKRTHIRRPRLS